MLRKIQVSIWSSEDKLADIALQLGWSEGNVKKYSALKVLKEYEILNENNEKEKVPNNAWKIIVPTFNYGTNEVPNGTFTEGVLRLIVKLTPPQQLDLVTDLANGTINKNKFKVLAEKYK